MPAMDLGVGRRISGSGVLTVPCEDFSYTQGGNTFYALNQQSSALAQAIFNAIPSTNLNTGLYTPFSVGGSLFSVLAATTASVGQAPPATGVRSTLVVGSCGLPSASGTTINQNLSVFSSTVTYSWYVDTEFWGTCAVPAFEQANVPWTNNAGRITGETQVGGNGFSIFEKPKVGGAWSLTIAGITISGTIQAGDPNGFSIDSTYSYYAYLAAATAYNTDTGSGTGATASATMNISLGGANVSIGEPLNGVWYAPGNSSEFLSWDLTNGVAVTTTGLNTNNNSQYGVGMYAAVPKAYLVTGSIRALDQPHPKSWNCFANAIPNPTTGNPTQQQVAFSAVPNISQSVQFLDYCQAGVFTGYGLMTGPYGPQQLVRGRPGAYGIVCWLDPASMSSNGETDQNPPNRVYDAWIPCRGPAYNALTFSIANNAIWDDLTQQKRWYRGGGASSPAGYPNTTNPSAGVMQFDETQDSGGNPPTQNWVSAIYPATVSTGYDVQEPDASTYRYLYFEIQASTGSSLACSAQITEGSGIENDKIWNFSIPTAATFYPITLDLCAPNSGGPAGTWQQDTRYAQSLSKNEWGVNLLNVLRLNLSASGSIYQIRNLRFQYSSTPRLTFVSEDGGAKDWGTSEPQTTPIRCCCGDTDGRRSFEGAGQIPNPMFPQGPLYLTRTVTQLAAELGTRFGVSASDISPSAWYVNPVGGSVGGNGRIFPGNGQNWIDQPSAGATVQANAQAVGLICPPYCGDIFNTGYSAGATKVYLQKTMRGRVTGLTLDPGGSGQPVSGVTVTLTEGLVPCGSGVSNSVGRYLTGPPYAVAPLPDVNGNDPPIVEAGTWTYQTFLSERYTRRICTLGSAQSETYPWHLQDARGSIHMVSTVNGDIVYRRSANSTPQGGWDAVKTVTSFGDCIHARHAVNKHTQRVHMLVTRTGQSVYELLSDSEGNGAGSGTDFTAGTLLVMAAYNATPWTENNGATGYTWFEYLSGTSGPGNQKGKYSIAAGAPFSATFTFLDQTSTAIQVADKGWAPVRAAKDNQQRLTWSPIIQGESIPSVWVSTDNARTWLRIT